MEKIRTTVRIAGKDYTMSGYDSENYMRRVAIMVDRKISELGMVTRLPAQDVAVLTAVTIADDLIKAQDENKRIARELMQARMQMEEMHKELEALKTAQAGEDK